MSDIDDIIDAILGEAAGEGAEGMRLIGEVIRNRMEERGLSAGEVVRQKRQFTGYENPGAAVKKDQQNPALRAIAEAAWEASADPADPTRGATHYWSPEGMIAETGKPDPYWANSEQTEYGRLPMGGHVFLPREGQGGGIPPVPAPYTQRPNRLAGGGDSMVSREPGASSQNWRMSALDSLGLNPVLSGLPNMRTVSGEGPQPTFALPSSFPADLPSFRRSNDVGEGTTFADVQNFGTNNPRPNRHYAQPAEISPELQFQRAGSPFPMPFPSTRMAEPGQPLATRQVTTVDVNPDGSIADPLTGDFLADYLRTGGDGYPATDSLVRRQYTGPLPSSTPTVPAQLPGYDPTVDPMRAEVNIMPREVPGQSIIERSNINEPRLLPNLEGSPEWNPGRLVAGGAGVGFLPGMPSTAPSGSPQMAAGTGMGFLPGLPGMGVGGPAVNPLPPLETATGTPVYQPTAIPQVPAEQLTPVMSPTPLEQQQASETLAAAQRGAATIPPAPADRRQGAQLLGRVGEYRPQGQGSGAQDRGGILGMMTNWLGPPRSGLPRTSMFGGGNGSGTLFGGGSGSYFSPSTQYELANMGFFRGGAQGLGPGQHMSTSGYVYQRNGDGTFTRLGGIGDRFFGHNTNSDGVAQSISG